VAQQDKAETVCVDHTPSRQDKLSYLSDIIREMTIISDDLGCVTLTGLLEVASREADIQARYGRAPSTRRN
jgi:hypothetical protein